MSDIITADQVASMLQVHVKTVYRLARQGNIPGNRIGGSWRFNKHDILQLVSGKMEEGSVDGLPPAFDTELSDSRMIAPRGGPLNFFGK